MGFNRQQPAAPQEPLNGSVERVTFHSEASGFCVLRTKVKGHRDVVTVIGNAASITAGEYIECQGVWVNDKTHGLQFKASTLNVVAPTTLEGIEKYLGSGMVKGIGPHFAKKLVKAFGEAVFDVIEHEPAKLLQLEGIGQKRTERITAAWEEQKAIRKIMVFLQSYGVGTARAVRIYKTYGDAAVDKVRENPYRLALDIYGIGFKTADTLAQRLGIEKDAPIRAQAGVRHVLQELCSNGHCAATVEQLIGSGQTLLELTTPLLQTAVEHEIDAENLISESIDDKACVFLPSLYRAETGVAERLSLLLQGEPPWGDVDMEKSLPWVEDKTTLQLSDSQRAAIHTVVKHKVAIITGGPGVGKTTIVHSLIKILQAKRMSIKLCAPTGRAAKRMQETTGITAKTIHRLLEFDPKVFGFKHNQDNPLPLDVLIVDEASMLDVSLMHALLKALPQAAALILVGDVDQLPSVGPGQVLADCIASNVIPTVRLTEIFRQAQSSQIIVNAHRINHGQMPLMYQGESDFYTVYLDTPEAIHDKLLQLVSERIPKKYRCNPTSAIQVLTPMNRGGLGARALNVALQQLLNGNSEPKITRFGWTFSPGDKVIQTVNNYDKEVFNGDIGVIDVIDGSEGVLYIHYDNRRIEYEFGELDEVSLAYATSIHKSQGSEYPIVVMPLATQHFTLLARNLVYTGVTRGKQLVILVAQKKAMGMAVHKVDSQARLTKLRERLIALQEGDE